MKRAHDLRLQHAFAKTCVLVIRCRKTGVYFFHTTLGKLNAISLPQFGRVKPLEKSVVGLEAVVSK